VIHSYNKSQQEALLLNFILMYNSTCFGQTYCRPSSATRQSTSIVWQIPVIVNTVSRLLMMNS